MADPSEIIEELRKMRGRPANRDWFAISAKAGSRKATVRIYDDIGWFGTSARSFAEELDDLDVDEIDLRLNSPGGDAWDGIAIFNTIRGHPAKVTVTVDGMAASAASVVAMAGDKIRMNPGAQMMVHDAGGFAVGNEATMLKTAEWLGKLSDSYADIYAARAGGTADQWRDVMREETWYKAAEAVQAGLADELADGDPDPEVTAKARWDLKSLAFAYAGRDAAPPPKIPVRQPNPQPYAPAESGACPSPAPVSAAEAARRMATASKTSASGPAAALPQEGAGLMDPAKIREAFGLAPDAPDDEVRAALAASTFASATTPQPAPAGDTDPETPPAPPATPTVTSDAILLDPVQYKALRASAMRGEEAWRKMRESECEAILDAAIKAGKFPPSRRDHWKALWAADPDGTKAAVEKLAANVIPVMPAGFPGTVDEDEVDIVYASMYGDQAKVGGRRG